MEHHALFKISVTPYDDRFNFTVCCPASLSYPTDHAVMFVMERFVAQAERLLSVSGCLIFWPATVEIPAAIRDRHAIVAVNNPRLEFCRFFRDNGISSLPPKEKFEIVDGAFIVTGAQIPESCTIMPGAYICSQTKLGENVYVGAGAKIVAPTTVGDNVIIRENTVLGANGLTTDRDVDGCGISMPQFGGVIIENDVEIGSNTVIARGAIDDTVIQSGSKIDNDVFISHNVNLGKNTFVVGETIFFGSSSTGKNAFISGNVAVRNKIKIGEGAFVGMGSVVTKDVTAFATVMGNPAKESKKD